MALTIYGYHALCIIVSEVINNFLSNNISKLTYVI